MDSRAAVRLPSTSMPGLPAARGTVLPQLLAASDGGCLLEREGHRQPGCGWMAGVPPCSARATRVYDTGDTFHGPAARGGRHWVADQVVADDRTPEVCRPPGDLCGDRNTASLCSSGREAATRIRTWVRRRRSPRTTAPRGPAAARRLRRRCRSGCRSRWRRRRSCRSQRPVHVPGQSALQVGQVDVAVGASMTTTSAMDLPPRQFVGVVLVPGDEHHRPLGLRDAPGESYRSSRPAGMRSSDDAGELVDRGGRPGPAEDHQVPRSGART